MPLPSTRPPGPSTSPTLQSKEWMKHPLDFLDSCAKQYGDNFTVELGSLGLTVFLSHPEAIKQLLSLPSHAYECHQYNQTYRSLMGDEALFLSDHQPHKRKRRLLMPSFHKERVKQYGEDIKQIVEEITQDWGMGQTIVIRPLIHEISLRVILKIIFGSISNPLSQVLRQLFKLAISKDFGSWSPWRRLEQRRSQLCQLIRAEIKTRRETENQSTDLLTMLICAEDEEGNLLSDAEIEDHLFTLLIAGVAPTAVALTWALYWIHENPSVKSTLVQEVRSLGTDFEALALTKLPYLTATYQEALRICPVLAAPSGRKLTQSVDIMGYHFETGTTLIPCIYLLHQREDLYSNPHLFQPERFLNHQYAPYEYMPFGGGNRLCLGSALAQLELRVVLGTILSHWDLENTNLEEVRPMRHGTVIAPSDAMQVTIVNKVS
ncbi:MAG: cytochrome P450 [Crocosphaera sp.]|nr:cytochrome P450 [Crocosphaera sp.]